MKKLFFFAMTAAVLMGCKSNEPGEGERVIDMLPKTRFIELTQSQKDFVNKNTDFSFNLFRAINQMPEGQKSNIISPISVTYVLGMLNDGAAGNTAKEITSVLGFGENNKLAVNEFCQKLIQEAPETDPSVTLKIANTVISNDYRQVRLAPQYQTDMENYYEAEVASLDFSNKTDALNHINGWCNDHTEGMIPKILSENELDKEALLLLMNAIYFKATWTDKFDANDTKDEAFTTEDGVQKTLPMMHRKARAICGENDIYTILNLPYGSGDKWSMRVLLPKEGKTIDDVINSLNQESWQEFSDMHSWEPPIVDIKIPRFSTAFETDLKKPLSALGAPSMFDSKKAQFPYISSNFNDIYVSLMKQKAAIEVNEEGTKASAVTVAVMGETAIGPIGKDMNTDFHCNRPFVYVIQEASSGTIFFLGTYRGE